MRRRDLLVTLPILGACGRKSTTIEGRWEGKLTNGLSTLTVNYDFLANGKDTYEFRFTCRDLFLATHPVSKWKLEGAQFTFEAPLIEGTKSFQGRFGGPTFDVSSGDEKMHLRRLGRPPSQPYRETTIVDLVPTMRSSRATAQMFGKREALLHFNADLLARLGISTTSKAADRAGLVFVDDMTLPVPVKGKMPEFLILLSPSQERLPEILKYDCPILVLLGEQDKRFKNLERGTRQIAYDLREALTKLGRKDYQISVVPGADETLRTPGFEKEYPRLTPQHLDFFRKFLARYEPSPSGV